MGQVCRGRSPEFCLNTLLPDVRPLQEPTGAPCCPLCLLQPACPAAGPAAAAKPLAPGAAGRGGAGARSRGLTSPPGLLGVGTAAVRLTCSGGGAAKLGCSSAHAHGLGGGPGLQLALWPL